MTTPKPGQSFLTGGVGFIDSHLAHYLVGTACGGEKRGLQDDVRPVIYDVSKMIAGWAPTLASAGEVRIAVRRLIEQWV